MSLLFPECFPSFHDFTGTLGVWGRPVSIEDALFFGTAVELLMELFDGVWDMNLACMPIVMNSLSPFSLFS